MPRKYTDDELLEVIRINAKDGEVDLYHAWDDPTFQDAGYASRQSLARGLKRLQRRGDISTVGFKVFVF